VIDGKKKRIRRRNGAVRPRSDGLRAARLGAIKNDILGNLRQHGLSIHGLASRHGISVGYVRQLFAAEGTTFSEFVLQQRLETAHYMLRDPGFANRSISAIAVEAGFGDLAGFNRAFRRHYGVVAAEVREAARRSSED